MQTVPKILRKSCPETADTRHAHLEGDEVATEDAQAAKQHSKAYHVNQIGLCDATEVRKEANAQTSEQDALCQHVRAPEASVVRHGLGWM